MILTARLVVPDFRGDVTRLPGVPDRRETSVAVSEVGAE